MATLDTPLEALAFEFGVFAVVNNLWTWIAVVTAAVSFWRIRGVTSIGNGCGLLEELTGSIEPVISGSKSISCSIDPVKSGLQLITGLIEPVKSGSQSITGPEEETGAPVKETVKKTEMVWEPSMCNDGVTRGKLTMYHEVEKRLDGELTDVNYGYGGGLDDCGEWWEKWEKVVKMRNGDDSWYRYVDLTVFNGNVVRLWDDNGVSNGGR